MANQKHGGIEWNDSSFKDKQGGGGQDRFLKLKPGSNLIRILTIPYQYYQHRYKFEGEKGFGHRIPCSIKHGSCVVCTKNNKPKKRYYLGVIDRATNSYKVLDIGWSVLTDIQTYADDSDWGDPIQYDFDIVVNPHGGPQNYYKAVAKPKRPLSAADLLLKEKVNLEYLESKCVPPEPQQVEEKFESLMQEFLRGGVSDQEQVDSPVSFKSAEDEADEDFPDSDKTIEAPF